MERVSLPSQRRQYKAICDATYPFTYTVSHKISCQIIWFGLEYVGPSSQINNPIKSPASSIMSKIMPTLVPKYFRLIMGYGRPMYIESQIDKKGGCSL